jgi:hypothetical protein
MRIKLYITAILLVLIGCDLDIPFEDQISGEDAIDNVQVAREALNVAYNNYPKEAMNFSVLADEFIPTYLINKSIGSKKFYQWEAYELYNYSESIWNSLYSVNLSVNIVLNSKDKIKFEESSEQLVWNKIEAECYAFKAMVYFDLLNLYADRFEGNGEKLGVIIKDKVTLEFLPRSTIDESVEEIDRLLTKALSMLNKEDRDVYHLDYYSVSMLKAKFDLYRKSLKSVIENCKLLIDEIGYEDLEPNQNQYNALWFDEKSDEKLFSIYNIQNLLIYSYIDSKENGDYIVLADDIEYEHSDVRKYVNVLDFKMKMNGEGDLVERELLGKYRTSVLDYVPKDINHFRLAELYFILAEAYYHKKSYSLVISTLNLLLKKRGASLIPEDFDTSKLLDKILYEKKKEFVGEGKLFFDYKRLSKSVNKFGIDSYNVSKVIKSDDYRWIFPIPIQEVKQNPNVEPSPKWDEIIKY